MQPTDFRSRRPPSPLSEKGNGYGPTPAPPLRYPPSHTTYISDADERREVARLDSGGRGLRKHNPPGGLRMTAGEWKLLIGICILAAGVRLFRISKPNSVVFDEVHFGKFAAKYINTRYYVDVHPPLAKLLITLSAVIGGFDGKFDFKEIGKLYEHVPYVTMRFLPALMGMSLVPLTYMTLRGLDCRATTAFLGAILVLFENGLITQSRLILLDSPLVFFVGLTTFFWVGFSNEDKAEPFTDAWWAWLMLTGLSLGAVFSCKWVGLFTIALVGFSTIGQLWRLMGDMKVSTRIFFRHFMARAFCLILIPMLFYMAMFEIHFLILRNSGDGDGFMSSEFQHTLDGRGMQDTFADVAIGSDVTIRHVNTQGGYLHSHAHNYPTGSNQQQVTLYPHRDGNNNFRLLNVTEEPVGPDGLIHIRNGIQVRIQHIATEKRLHSHDVRPPVTEVDFQQEVSGYGFAGFTGDANDNWFVEIDKGDKHDPESFKRLRTLRTRFRLRHAMTGCYLFSHKVKLPEWGFEQQEVTCNKQAVKPNSWWMIETNTHELLSEDSEKVNYKLPGFLGKFLELQVVMWRTNAGLTDRHTYDSRPQSWPFLRRGINFWVKDHRQIYLIGNPIIWWLSSLAVFAYLGVRALLILRAKRGFKDFNNTTVVKYDNMTGFLVMGWALHYLPFFLMSRQLFLHHYFPALYFSILTFASVFDLVTSNLRPRLRLQVAGGIAVVAIWSYLYFSPLAYGNQWTRSKCEKAKWLKTWDFSCNDFLAESSDYKTIVPITPGAPAVTTIAGGGGRPPVVVPVQPPVSSEHVGDQDYTTAPIQIPIEPVRDAFQKDEEDVMTTQGVPVEQLNAQADAELKAAKAKGRGKDYVRTDKDGQVIDTKTEPKVVGPPSPSDEALRAAKGDSVEEEVEEVKHEEKKPVKEAKKPSPKKKKPLVDEEEFEEEKKAPKVAEKETKEKTPEEFEADRVREKLFADK